LRLGSLVLALALAASPLTAAPAASTPAGTGPRISVEPEAFDFGKALQNKVLHKDFVIRNIGTEDLVIDRVTTTCGCTVAEGYAKLVKPGQSTTMDVQLQTRSYNGRVERKILVRSNDATRDPMELKVQVSVVPQP
jgi:hypothetical protein